MKIRNLFTVLLVLIITNCTTIFAETGENIFSELEMLIPADKINIKPEVLETISEIYNSNYNKDVSNIQAINKETDKLLLMDLESGITREMSLKSYNLLNNDNLIPIALIQDGIYYIPTSHLEIVNTNINKLINKTGDIKNIFSIIAIIILIFGFILLVFTLYYGSNLKHRIISIITVILLLLTCIFCSTIGSKIAIDSLNEQAQYITNFLKDDYLNKMHNILNNFKVL